eukprot:GHVQ01006949.1.p1 GENE.GHVQ01006949.1~~GHVQ01006949.1.p1  ORF type:complete len:506 (-),score=66.33 GHVQ01006949.1:278-1795(-)
MKYFMYEAYKTQLVFTVGLACVIWLLCCPSSCQARRALSAAHKGSQGVLWAPHTDILRPGFITVKSRTASLKRSDRIAQKCALMLESKTTGYVVFEDAFKLWIESMAATTSTALWRIIGSSADEHRTSIADVVYTHRFGLYAYACSKDTIDEDVLIAEPKVPREASRTAAVKSSPTDVKELVAGDVHQMMEEVSNHFGAGLKLKTADPKFFGAFAGESIIFPKCGSERITDYDSYRDAATSTEAKLVASLSAQGGIPHIVPKLWYEAAIRFLREANSKTDIYRFYVAYCKLQKEYTPRNLAVAGSFVSRGVRDAYTNFLAEILASWAAHYGSKTAWITDTVHSNSAMVHRYSVNQGYALSVIIKINALEETEIIAGQRFDDSGTAIYVKTPKDDTTQKRISVLVKQAGGKTLERSQTMRELVTEEKQEAREERKAFPYVLHKDLLPSQNLPFAFQGYDKSFLGGVKDVIARTSNAAALVPSYSSVVLSFVVAATSLAVLYVVPVV